MDGNADKGVERDEEKGYGLLRTLIVIEREKDGIEFYALMREGMLKYTNDLAQKGWVETIAKSRDGMLGEVIYNRNSLTL